MCTLMFISMYQTLSFTVYKLEMKTHTHKMNKMAVVTQKQPFLQKKP